MEKKTREQAIEELSLMLLYLMRFRDNNEFCRYMEPSWKGYDFDVLNGLEEKEYLYQPNKTKISYLSEVGKEQARRLLQEYNIADTDIMERFEFRNIKPEETAPELFLVAVDRSTGKIAGFLNGLSTNEYSFRDEFFTDASLYDPDGKNIMLLGLDVLPEYRKQGLAREIMFQYLRRERENDRRIVFLTCLQNKVKMYKKFGFIDKGIADSTWGEEQWHELTCVIG